jgi:hypothetical protein
LNDVGGEMRALSRHFPFNNASLTFDIWKFFHILALIAKSVRLLAYDGRQLIRCGNRGV